MQLGPLEVGVVVGTVLAAYAAVRGAEVVAATRGASHAFWAALRGGGRASAV